MVISVRPTGIESDGLEAFDDWVKSVQGRGVGSAKAESIEIYGYQWQQYIQYLVKQGLTIFQATSETVEQFLFEKARLIRDSQSRRQKGELNQYEQLSRYRRLLERVYENIILKNRNKIFQNPASLSLLASKAWTSAEKKDLRGFLTNAECDVLESFLELVASNLEAPSKTPHLMINNRPYVTTALIAGAGLKSREITALTISDLNLKEGYLGVTSDESGIKRTILLKEGGYLTKLLEAWIKDWYVHVAPILSDVKLVFPSVLRNGQPNATQLEATTLLRNVRSVFAEALEHPDAALPIQRDQALAEFLKRNSVINPQLIRNTYVARLFSNGSSSSQVTEHMGFAVEVIAERIWLSWMKWRSVYDKLGFIEWVKTNNWDPRLYAACQTVLGPSFTEQQLHNLAKQFK